MEIVCMLLYGGRTHMINGDCRLNQKVGHMISIIYYIYIYTVHTQNIHCICFYSCFISYVYIYILLFSKIVNKQLWNIFYDSLPKKKQTHPARRRWRRSWRNCRVQGERWTSGGPGTSWDVRVEFLTVMRKSMWHRTWRFQKDFWSVLILHHRKTIGKP